VTILLTIYLTGAVLVPLVFWFHDGIDGRLFPAIVIGLTWPIGIASLSWFFTAEAIQAIRRRGQPWHDRS
jgi:hypothetical protein